MRLKKKIRIKVFFKECFAAGNQRAQVLAVTALVAAREWERGHVVSGLQRLLNHTQRRKSDI